MKEPTRKQREESMYASGVEAVVRAVGSKKVHSFMGNNSADVISACDAGLCRLVPENNHKALLITEPGRVTGVELTPDGERVFGSLK